LRFLVDDHRQRIDGSLIIPNDLPYGTENLICTRLRQVGFAEVIAEYVEIERLFLGLKFRELLRSPLSLLGRGRLGSFPSCAALGALQ
jgi:hypothetical protein